MAVYRTALVGDSCYPTGVIVILASLTFEFEGAVRDGEWSGDGCLHLVPDDLGLF